ncbi:MAG TPA: lysozyme inhibitor LprI family protein [Xanthomonadales bacterium]|nr:lysozyme inhibitor LprI family protein [Xanthomonadales bacterium]
MLPRGIRQAFASFALLAATATGASEPDPRCEAVRGVEPPTVDLPDAASRARLAGCDAAALYYGVGMPADLADARRCAFIESADGVDDLFAGAGILMMLYANAQGVERNLPLARRYACLAGGAPAELAGRLEYLDSIERDPLTTEPLDACDHVTSGDATGMCAQHAADVAGVARAARLAQLRANWTPAVDAAYAKLRAAADRFIDARVDGEVDMSGTARGALAVGAREDFEESLLASLEATARGEHPAFDAAEERAADAALNEAYRRARAAAAPVGEGDEAFDALGTVTADAIRDAQRAWIPYRDAWAAFGAAIAPGVPAHAWLAQATRARVAMLEELAGD